MHPSSHKAMRYFSQKYVVPPCSVADIGSCDYNSYRDLFENCSFTGLDTREGPNVDRVVEDYDFGDTQYDVVISGQCMEHVKDLHRWRDQVIRIVKPGGLLCVIAPHTWPYHGHPMLDCWRILPDGMRWLFRHTEILECFMNETDTVFIGRKL